MPRLMAHYTPPAGALEVLHRDDDLLLIEKPSGLLSVPGKPAAHWDCVEHRVKQADPAALLIHRLDLETSGVMVFARNPGAQKIINGQFERRIVEKTYIAVVAGHVEAEAGRIELPLTADWPNRPMQKVCWAHGKSAITAWRVLARGDKASRVALWPKTGRSHQLRVHLKAIGHPILGDPFYAPEPVFKATARLQLHASRLALRHPQDGRWCAWESAVPF
ncbi:MAG: RluA family pseudouridine synthase [Pseudomonadota bacterium]